MRLPLDGDLIWVGDSTRSGQADVQPQRQASMTFFVAGNTKPALRHRLHVSQGQFWRYSRLSLPADVQQHRLSRRYVDFRQIEEYPAIRHHVIGDRPFPQDPIVFAGHNVHDQRSCGAGTGRYGVQFKRGQTL